MLIFLVVLIVCLTYFYKSYFENNKTLIVIVRMHTFEPVHEKTNNLGFRPGLTQTGLYKHRRWLEA